MSKKSPSKAYLKFEGVVNRSLNLLTLHDSVSKMWQVTGVQPPPDLSDMGRASVVLAVAAMDAYFTNVFVERLVPFLKKHGTTKDLVNLLSDAGLDAKCALELLVVKRPFLKIRRMVERHLDLHVTQKTDVIDKLFAIYGFKDFTTNVARYSGKQDRVLKSLDRLIKRRHKIAHVGDLNSHGVPRQVDIREFRYRIKMLVVFVSKADELLHKQLNRN